jgi:hypothetical protein
MYNPLERLCTFIPCDSRGDSSIPDVIISKPRRIIKKKSTKKHILTHVVSLATFRKELGGVEGGTVRELCARIPEVLIALGTAKSDSHAKTLAKLFGSGNLLIYVLLGGPYDQPQYLAVGITEFCTIEDHAVKGSWRVVSTLGASANAFSYAATEGSFINAYDHVFHWSTVYPIKLLASYWKQGFIKVILPTFDVVYAAMCAERSRGVSAKDIVSESPHTRRLVLLMELLFTFDHASREVFLHFVSENVQ